MTCHTCGFSNFRLSRFRFGDLSRLAVLQYPVRCRNCGTRAYSGWLSAFAIYRTRKTRRAEYLRNMKRAQQ